MGASGATQPPDPPDGGSSDRILAVLEQQLCREDPAFPRRMQAASTWMTVGGHLRSQPPDRSAAHRPRPAVGDAPGVGEGSPMRDGNSQSCRGVSS